MSYVPSTNEQRNEMLKAVGVKKYEDLYANVDKSVLISKLDLPEGTSELEVSKKMKNIASKNRVYKTIFRGAGAYNHYIPAIVKSVASKEEFVTAYTPYQAEISQGVLQSIFEYQTMICSLTAMDASNASVYDGASAAAESVAMCHTSSRNVFLMSESTNPMVKRTVQSYCYASGTILKFVPIKNGITDINALRSLLDENVCGFYLQSPNFFGLIEETEEIEKAVHLNKSKFIMGINPISAAILKSAGECNADIAVGEGQPLGIPLSFGGPYLGFMAAKYDMLRKLPGRIVGETVDANGERAFVLTLQTREQHIRREKASSNICSNEAHCALISSVYLSAMGKDGLMEVASQCMAKAHYLKEKLCTIKGFNSVFDGEFFNEFVTTCPIDKDDLIKKLSEEDILAGLPIDEGILWCATELNSKEEMDKLIQTIERIVK